ncbi:unnamed protein product [Prorocentrum cordatum]|uniref:Ion transport domain-containing protein n=1 Tax=Prorocentrum cordatum TaxID=2364126 RepID=A0ABN9QL30_9DINO|nr:unnamed protein product [Polarella glacialis]
MLNAVFPFFRYARDNHLEMRLRHVVLQYARTWMAVDVYLLLLDLGFLLLDFHTGARAFRMVRLLRLLRLFRIQKWQASMMTWVSTGQSEYVVLIFRISRLSVQLLLMCHYIACAWFGVGELNLHGEFAHWGRGGSWVEENDVLPNGFLDSYAMSLHWSITQFTPSTNNIAPKSTMERLFAVGVVMLGMLFFSGFLSTLTSMVNQMKAITSARVQDRLRLLRFIRSKHISHKLGQRMLTFFDLDGGRRDRILIEGDIPVLQQMPESVIFSLHQEMYLYLVRANPDLDAFLNLNVGCFWNICHEAMSDHRFMAQQEPIAHGSPKCPGVPGAAGRLSGASALTSERGITLESSAGSQPSSNPTPLQVSIVDTQAWLAEAALWMKWSHRGTLACHCVCRGSKCVKFIPELFK